MNLIVSNITESIQQLNTVQGVTQNTWFLHKFEMFLQKWTVHPAIIVTPQPNWFVCDVMIRIVRRSVKDLIGLSTDWFA